MPNYQPMVMGFVWHIWDAAHHRLHGTGRFDSLKWPDDCAGGCQVALPVWKMASWR